MADTISDFKVVVKRIEDGEIRYYQKLVSGIERMNSGLNRFRYGLRKSTGLPAARERLWPDRPAEHPDLVREIRTHRSAESLCQFAHLQTKAVQHN